MNRGIAHLVGRSGRRAARLRPLLGLLTTLLAAGPAAFAAPALAADVAVTDNAFVAPGISVAPGETVTWAYANGGDIHNVVFDGAPPPFPPMPSSPTGPPWSDSVTFTNAGTYKYYCAEHGGPVGD
ncbi:MAG TPA: plastocyanin/azurin family copper-binding protein, partial [Solirubrobacteraceae bacterium]|nr:plastocyanin/azurin family copper-binding protein [Solirubrobacteraceae bacterium]